MMTRDWPGVPDLPAERRETEVFVAVKGACGKCALRRRSGMIDLRIHDGGKNPPSSYVPTMAGECRASEHPIDAIGGLPVACCARLAFPELGRLR